MAQEVIVNVKANTKEAQASLQGVNSEIKQTQQVSGELTGSLNAMTGGAITKFNAFKGTLKGVTGGFKSLRVAIISTGIGALILAVGALTAAFTGSEEGQNKFAKIMTVIGALTGNLVDLLADLGEKIIEVFENPKQAITDFANLIKENITNRFEGMLELIPQLGKAVKLLFSGEFAEAGEVAANAAAKVVLGVEDITDKIESATQATKEFVKEQINEAKAAANVADMRAKADKIERKLVVDRSKLESEIALLRLKSRQEEEFGAEERKQALLDAQALEEQLLNKETEYLELRRDAQVLENTFSRSNKENLDKEAQAIAEVNRVVARRADAARSTQRELNRVSKEIERDEQAKAKAEQDRQDAADKAAKEKLDAIDKIREDYRLKQEDKEVQSALQKAELEEQRKLSELEALGAELAQKQEVIDYYAQIKLDAEAADAAASKAIEEKALADKIAIIQAEQSAREANLQSIANGLNGLQNVFKAFGKESKALAIASIIVDQVGAVSRIISNTGIANAKAVATSPLTLGQPWVTINTISAAASIAGSIAGAGKSIAALKGDKKTPLSTAIPRQGSSGGGGITSASQAPQFNIVGGGASNQLAGLLAEQGEKPIRAYVVSNEVSTAQSLDRNIVESATLG